MNLPTIDEVDRLHRKYAPTDEAYRVVYGHCKIIAEIASEIIASNQLSIDTHLVHIGAFFIYRRFTGSTTMLERLMSQLY
jgi:uncharacterized protein